MWAMARADKDSFEAADRLVLAAIRLVRTLKILTPPEALTETQVSALAIIIYSEGITARELARLENVRPPSISVVVAQLEALGLIFRTADPKDARKLWISATQAGKRAFFAGHRRRLAPLASALAGLSRADRAAIEACGARMQSLCAQLARGGLARRRSGQSTRRLGGARKAPPGLSRRGFAGRHP